MMRLSRSLRKPEIEADRAVEAAVREILDDVRLNGDEAVEKYSKKFDRPFEMGGDVSPDHIAVLKRAKEQIEEFHKKQIGGGFEIRRENGAILGQMVRPLGRVAIYVPGGTAPYPSSVLMNVIPAKLAGVPEIAIFTPRPNNIVLATARVCGVETIYQIGGAQAVAAAAFGTETIPKFDKIVGPGNIYVATAKRMVYGEVDIDMVAGPSEILIIADDTANPAYVAADLLSQAEHDPMARAILITTSEKLIDAVEKEIARQIAGLSRADIIEKSLENFGCAILVDSLDEAVEIANDIAPEHLEILTENPFGWLPKIRNAGSVFLGEYTPEPLGDYMSGTNHVLPTGGTARFYSPLGVYDFVKFSSYSYYPKSALKEFADDIVEFAGLEGLDAHANSIEVRFK
jgi:histidinol dehydrogenase